MVNAYQFVQRVCDHTGALIAEQAITDFRPLAEDVAFSAVLEGRLANDGKWGAASVEPLFEEEKLAGVTVRRAGQQKSYRNAVFADNAWAILLAAGGMDDEDNVQEKLTFTWELQLRLRDPDSQKKRLAAAITYAPFPLTADTVAGLGIAADGRQTDIWVSSTLLDELRESAVANLDRERAHFLTGRLLNEGGRGVVVLSGSIAAEIESGSSAVHFGFSPQTFAAARREAERRNDGLSVLAWAHNHPPPCRRDCLAVVPPCKSDNVFFSVADRGVHRAGFSAPYAVALVAGKAAGRRADDPEFRAYGWRDGLIVEKDFYTF
jgi:hypothetical protein